LSKWFGLKSGKKAKKRGTPVTLGVDREKIDWSDRNFQSRRQQADKAEEQQNRKQQKSAAQCAHHLAEALQKERISQMFRSRAVDLAWFTGLPHQRLRLRLAISPRITLPASRHVIPLPFPSKKPHSATQPIKKAPQSKIPNLHPLEASM
jgi:hypothetical protein